jgi:hypothetical protein
MPRMGFEHMIPVFERAKTVHALNRAASGSSHVGFVVDKVALGQVLSEYFDFPCQSSFHQFLHNYHHLSSIIGQ